MKTYNTSNVRNVVLLGSSKSGKTTFAETMMFEGKVIERRGTIEGKNTMSDNTEIEQIYQRSIYSTLLYTEFLDTKFNIIDTPGSDDFVGGVYSAFSVAENGILLVNATQGVEVGTEIFARHAVKHQKYQVSAEEQINRFVPLIFAVFRLQNFECSGKGAAAGSADCQLHKHYRKTENCQEKEIKQDKKSAAVLSGNIRKSPDIAQTDGTSGTH